MNARQSQRFALKTVAVATLACFGANGWANPSGGTVASGNATFNQVGNSLIVTNTPGTIINWQQFSIGSGELTKFIQQNSDSAVLNRIIGQDPSQILGQLQSNGRVFLINPNGIVFGHGAQIDTAGLVASTLNISDADFTAGKLRFQGAATGSVQNAANITTPSGGFVYLIAPDVQNTGVIVSPKGEILLAAGSSVELVDGVDTSLRVKLTAPGGNVINVGQLIAEQGRIGIFAAAIRQQGIASANHAELGEGGKIVLKASQSITLDAGSVTSATGGGQVLVDTTAGDTVVRGLVDVSSASGTGGSIALLGERVGVFDHATVDASGLQGGGIVLVGGDYQGKNAAIHNAQQTVLGANAVIHADAGTHGDGGKVILWSDGLTTAAGAISVKGGAAGGNGGFVETSGKQQLDFRALVDAGAAAGKTGTLLLDPSDITVAVGGTDLASDASSFTAGPSGGSSPITVSPTTLLATNADVILQAQNSITFSDSLSLGSHALTAQAQSGNISVGASAALTASAISLSAGSSGSITLNGSLNASSITLNSTDGPIQGSTATITTSNLSLTGSANVDLTGSANQIGAIGCGANACSVSSLDLANTTALTLYSLNATGSDINIRNSGAINVAGVVSAGFGHLALDSGSGAISTTAAGRLESYSGFQFQTNGGTGSVGSASSPLNISVPTSGSQPGTLQATVGYGYSSGPAVGGLYLNQVGTPTGLGVYVYPTLQGGLSVSGNQALNFKTYQPVNLPTISLASVGNLNTPAISITGGSVSLSSSSGTVLLGSTPSISATSLSISGSIIDFEAPAASLSTISASSLSLQADSLSNLAAVPSVSVQNLTLASNTSAGNLSLTQTEFDKLGGSLSHLTLSGTGSVSLPNVTVSGGIGGNVGGGISLGTVNASSVSLGSGGGMSLGDILATNSISLDAKGALASTGSLSAPSVSVSAAGDLGTSSSPLYFFGTNNLTLNSTTGGVFASSNGGSATLNAQGGIGFTTSGVSTVSASTTTGNLSLNSSAANLTVNRASTGSGNVAIQSGGTATLAGVSGTNVNITAVGALAGGGVTGDEITLQAATVGQGGVPFAVNAGSSLTVTTTGSGGIWMSEQDSVGLATLTTKGGGIRFSAGGNASVNANTGGSVGEITLSAKGALTTAANTLQADKLTVTAGGDLILGGSLIGNTSLVLASGGKFETHGTYTAPSLDLTTVQDIGSAANPFIINSASVGLHTTGAGSSIFAQGLGGSVSLSAGGGQINYLGSGASLISLGGSYSLLNLSTSNGDLSVTGTNALAGSVVANLAATNGNIAFASNQGATVAASAGGAGHGVSLTTTSGDLNVQTLQTGGGALTLASAGKLLLPTGQNLVATDLTLKSADSFVLSNALTASSSLTIESSQGSVTTAAGGTFSAPTLTLKGAQGVGSAGSLVNVQTGNLTAESTAGGVFIAAGNGLTTANLKTSGGDVILQSAGATAVNGDINAGKGKVQLTTTGDLLGKITGSNLNLTIGGALGSSSQRVELTAPNLLINAKGSVYGAATGDVLANITTANGGIDLTDSGALTIAGSAGGNGNIVLASAGNLTFAGLQTGGDVTATATGSLLGSGSGDILTANLATFSAGGSIGPLSTKLQQLKATVGGSIDLTNSVPLQVVSLQGGGDLRFESTGGLTTIGTVVVGGKATFVTHSPLTIGSGGVTAGNGISLQSGTGTGNDNVTINGALETATGDCSVQAGGSVLQNANITVGGSGGIAVNAATGDVLMAPGTASATQGGTIGYAALGGIALASLDAGTTGSVSLNATQGSVVSVTPGGINIRAGNLDVTAAGSIDLGVDVPASGLNIRSAIGYQVLHGKDGSLLPGSKVPSDAGNGQQDAVTGVTNATNTILQGNSGNTQDTTQKKINNQQSGDGQSGGNEGNSDDKRKKPKKC